MILDCAHCDFYGLIWPPDMPSGINIQGNVILRCPECGKRGNALRGIYTYDYGYIRYYADKIAHMQLGKRQAKRAYEKIRKSKRIENLPTSLAAIDPALGELAEEAVNSPEPKSLLKQMGLVLGFIGGVGLAVLTGLEITEKVGLLDEVQKAVHVAYHGEQSPKIETETKTVETGGSKKNSENEADEHSGKSESEAETDQPPDQN